MNFWMIGTINGIITLTWKKVTKVSKFTLYNDDVVVLEDEWNDIIQAGRDSRIKAY